jgi:nitrate reductase assembly molybdenum cofactor insertion protein NarJ
MQHYKQIASIFAYPESGYKDQMNELRTVLYTKYPDVIPAFEIFYNSLSDSDRVNEEYYLKTFEIEGICCMDMGYVLFGADYKRGDFLAKISHEQKESGNNTGIELADHLPNILTLLPLHKDKDFIEELAYGLIIPAAKEMHSKFNNTENYYKQAFEVLISVLEKDFHDLPIGQFTISSKEEKAYSEEYACGADFLKEKSLK